MSIALLLIGDGRPYRLPTLNSLADAVDMTAFSTIVEVDDSGHEMGFAGAIQYGWDQVLDTGADYCLHVELDFTFNRPAPLAAMVAALHTHPYLVQIALLRQPWSDAERAAGGIVQQHPASYEPIGWGEHRWLEHRRFVTTNPCVWPRWVMERGWPQRSQSEGHFGIDLFAMDPRLRAAYWGDGEEWVEHIGRERAGAGY